MSNLRGVLITPSRDVFTLGLSRRPPEAHQLSSRMPCWLDRPAPWWASDASGNTFATITTLGIRCPGESLRRPREKLIVILVLVLRHLGESLCHLGENLRHYPCARLPPSWGEPPPSRGEPPPLFLCWASAVLGRASAILDRAYAVLGTASAIIPSSGLFEGELAHTPYGLPQQTAISQIREGEEQKWRQGEGRNMLQHCCPVVLATDV